MTKEYIISTDEECPTRLGVVYAECADEAAQKSRKKLNHEFETVKVRRPCWKNKKAIAISTREVLPLGYMQGCGGFK